MTVNHYDTGKWFSIFKAYHFKTMHITREARLTGHTGPVYALEESGLHDSFFSGGGDGIVAEWDFNALDEGQLITKVADPIYSLFHHREQNLLLIGQSGGGIHFLNLDSRTEERLIKLHNAPVFDLKFSKKHNLLFSLAGNGMLGVTYLKDMTHLETMKICEGKLRSAALNADESILAIGCGQGTVLFYSLPGLNPLGELQAHKPGYSVYAVVFSPDNRCLVTGARDAHLNIFDVNDNYSRINSIPAHNYSIYSIVFSPDKKHIATCSRDKTVKIWNADNFNVIERIDKEKYDAHINSVNKLLWHSFTKKLVSAGDDQSIMVWDVRMGDRVSADIY